MYCCRTKLKQKAHLFFDRLWLDGHMTRDESYEWLAHTLDVPKDFCHMGLLTNKKLIKAIKASKKLLRKLERKRQQVINENANIYKLINLRK